MSYREILETYLNSVPKNTSETGIFPHGIKFLLTSVILDTVYNDLHLRTGEKHNARDPTENSVLVFSLTPFMWSHVPFSPNICLKLHTRFEASDAV